MRSSASLVLRTAREGLGAGRATPGHSTPQAAVPPALPYVLSMGARSSEQLAPARFRSSFPDETLLEAIREIVQAVDAEWPQDVRAAQFDGARATSRWPDLPSAAAIQRRWQMAWPQILAMLFVPGRDPAVTLRVSRRRTAGVRVTLEQAVYYLKLIAGRLAVTTLTAARYDRELAILVSESRAAWLHGGSAPPPTSADIDAALRADGKSGWQVALDAAGLQSPRSLGAPKGMEELEAARRFLSEVGCLPWSRAALDEFMRRKQLSLAAKSGLPAVRAQLVEEWRALGRWTPTAPPRPGARPEIAVEPADNGDDQRRRWATDTPKEEVLSGLARAYETAARLGQQLTQKLQRQLATHDGSIPHPSFVARWAKNADPPTTPAALRAEALEASPVGVGRRGSASSIETTPIVASTQT